MTISTASRTTIVPIDRAYDHPDELLRLVQASGPYWNQSRYIPNGAKLGPGHPLVAPDGPPGFPATAVFRADWFRRTDSTPDGRRLAFHEPFLAAARVVHGGEHVVPFLVHVNLNAPGPSSDAGHLDVPAFRGLDLRTAPGWLLLGLARTGLAGRWRLRVATAISWLYRGEGGGFTCWPDGPQGTPETITDLWNRAVVLDADTVHHRVESVGRPGTPAAAVTRQSSIAVAEDRWVVDGAGPADVVRARRCPRERLVEGRGVHIGARARRVPRRTRSAHGRARGRAARRRGSPPRWRPPGGRGGRRRSFRRRGGDGRSRVRPLVGREEVPQ